MVISGGGLSLLVVNLNMAMHVHVLSLHTCLLILLLAQHV